MVNLGAQPLDPTSPVGRLRVNLGDTSFRQLDTPLPGYVDYANFSDIDLATLYAEADQNLSRATGRAYLRLAAQYAILGRSIKTDDLSIDTKNRGRDLLEVGNSWLAQADQEDAAEASDFFELVGFAPSFMTEQPAPFYVHPPVPVRPGAPSSGAPNLIPDPQNPGYWMPA